MSHMISGVIQNTQKPVIFSAEEDKFIFRFMTDAVPECGESIEKVIIPNQDSFVFGKIHDSNQTAAIYIGNEQIELHTTQQLTTGAYVISSIPYLCDKPLTFMAISFTGGSLNTVFHPDRLDFSFSRLQATIKSDTKSFVIETSSGESIGVSIESDISMGYEHNGKLLRNTEVTLTLKFTTPQNLRAIFKHYNTIKKILSFLCFRKNVGFESVQLLNPSEDHDGALLSVGNVYINDSKNYAVKDWATNICIRDLGCSFPELIKLFYDDSDNPKTPILGFLPTSESDSLLITAAKVKEICSSLEVEFEHAKDIAVPENRQIDEIKKLAGDAVKEYRKNNPGLSDKTYNMVFSTIRNWSLALHDKIVALSERYKEELELINETSTVIDDDNIGAMVKYRNNATHSNTIELTPQIIDTAYYMQALVYFCILDRIGVPRDKIKELCNHRLLK